MSLILEDLAPEPANEIHDAEHLVKLLNEGMASSIHAVTDEAWLSIRNEVVARHSSTRSH
jgi:hypothetical protein